MSFLDNHFIKFKEGILEKRQGSRPLSGGKILKSCQFWKEKLLFDPVKVIEQFLIERSLFSFLWSVFRYCKGRLDSVTCTCKTPAEKWPKTPFGNKEELLQRVELKWLEPPAKLRDNLKQHAVTTPLGN